MDWGLGHTTRCIPFIRFILRQGHVPVFAGNEWQQEFIKQYFPHIEALQLEGYNVRYATGIAGTLRAIMLQLPRLIKMVSAENEWLAKCVKQYRIDGIISDNRYGLYHDEVPNVLLTHQLQILTGLGSYMDGLLRTVHYRYINRFRECWVPDLPDGPGLAGILSHPDTFPNKMQYIGLLSQFDSVSYSGSDRHLLVLLSGPEPQRTILSDLLWQEITLLSTPIVFVEGSDRFQRKPPSHVTYFQRIGDDKLLPLLRDAETVIARSGYSTVMDLVALRKKAILVPTPGQTEQEYLGLHLECQKMFLTAKQRNFCLKDNLDRMQSFPFAHPLGSDAFYNFEPPLSQWLQTL